MELQEVEIKIEEIYTCRICMEDDILENFISPCNCDGTSKYVHEECLTKWRTGFRKYHLHRWVCQTCHALYNYEVEGFVTRLQRREEHIPPTPVAEVSKEYILCIHLIVSIILLFICLICFLMYATMIKYNGSVMRQQHNNRTVSNLFHVQYGEGIIVIVLYMYHKPDCIFMTVSCGLLLYLIFLHPVYVFVFNALFLIGNILQSSIALC